MEIPFSPPYIDDDVKKEVAHVLESAWITTGHKTQAVAKLLSEKVRVDHVLCCNSATSGLLLALHWFGVTKGDEVIIPSYTYAATALAVMHVGATPVMVDVASDFNISVEKIREKITGKTKAIIPVDVAGWPCDYDELYSLVNDSGLRQLFIPRGDVQEMLGRMLILADAAHSIGALYKNKPSGKLADISVFSFHAVKNVTTAEGGAICINLPPPFENQKVYEQMKLWTLNGQTKDAFSKTNGKEWRYDIVYPGYKMNMPDICAAIGLAQLRKYDSFILPARRQIFTQYIEAFSKFDWAELPYLENEHKQSACHVFALRIHKITEEMRDEMISAIMEEGVSVNVHFQPLPMLTVFRERGHAIKDHPVAFHNYSREISLPVYPGLDPGQVEYVISVVAKAYHSVNRFHAKANS